MSIRGKFPEQRPTLNLDFANSKKLDPHITFTRTSIGTRVTEENVLETISADDPRFDHDPTTGESLGLLIEELRTNDIRNSTMQGAASGTPGTPPTNWSMGTSSGGLTREISAVGEENGISYIDVRWHGVATGNPNSHASFYPDGTTTTNSPATRTSRYTFSSYVKHISGTVPSGCTFILVISNMNSSLAGLNEYKTSTIISSSSIPSGDLIANRFALTNTDFTSTDTAYFRPYYQWNVPYNTSFDVTIRIGLSQMEEGSFATSAIPTTNQGVTRTADNVTMTGTNFSDFYNQDEGTVYVSQKLRAVQDTNRNNLVYLINGGANNDYFYNTNKGNQHIFVFGDGGTNYSRFQDGTDSTDSKIAWAYDVSGDDFKPYYDGIEVTNETDNNTPSATSHTQLELGATASAKYCGHISKFTYYPSRLPNDQLQSLTK